MFLLVLSLIILIAILIIAGLKKEKSNYGRDRAFWKWNKTQWFALLPLTLCVFNFFTVIPANSVGVQYSYFTGVKEAALPEGIHSKGFFDKIYKISTEVQTKHLENIYGQTKDSQYVVMILDIKYRISSKEAFDIFRKFKTLDAVDENLISPTAQRSIEAITTGYNIIELLGSERNNVYKEMEIELRNRLALDGITLHSVTMIDTDAGEEIERAIQAEAIAKKSVETAEQERKKAEIDAQKRVVEAEADKTKAKIEVETQIIKAKANAEEKIINAESNAKAYQVMNQYITKEALDKMWIDKWDGELPQVVSGDNGLIYNLRE